MEKKGGDLKMNKEKLIPKHFKSEEEAGRFWDTHSGGDYWKKMVEVEIDFDIKKRTFLVPVKEEIYKRVRRLARSKHSTVGQIIDNYLSHLATAK